MKIILFILAIILTNFSWAKAPDFTKMTASEKQATGINKLSPEELDALTSWLNNEQRKLERAKREREAGFQERRQQITNKFRAKVEKQYTDKLGRTFYELDNGQIWRQISTGRIFFKDKSAQIVTVEPGTLGSWEMQGDGNAKVKIKRIK